MYKCTENAVEASVSAEVFRICISHREMADK